MGKPTGFMEYGRLKYPERPIPERIKDYKEIYQQYPHEELKRQGARCMDCGIPFCHQGCPLGNLIPDWNDLVYRDHWEDAIIQLHRTNNFPEFTGTLCPAPCESSCVLGINQPPVTIKYIELNIIENAIGKGWIKPQPPKKLTGKKVAVVGSGPAGLACAQQLRRVGHEVVVFERDNRIGGLLRYGIPDFKMEKERLDFRLKQMEEEGVKFKAGVNVGINLSIDELKNNFSAVSLCGGATLARNLDVPGGDLKGVHLAMEYLTQQNRVNAGDTVKNQITAEGKHVIILGGGDTGADCLGTVHRQGAKSVYQIELLPKPPPSRDPENPWPQWPLIFRTYGAHAEGGIRDYSILTKKLSGENGVIKKLHAVHLEWIKPQDGSRPQFKEIPGSEFALDCDLLLLALGFVGPEKNGLLNKLGVEYDPRGNVKTNDQMMTSIPGFFSAGDMHRGQSLIVWAIAEGRKCAQGIDQFLMKETELPAPW